MAISVRKNVGRRKCSTKIHVEIVQKFLSPIGFGVKKRNIQKKDEVSVDFARAFYSVPKIFGLSLKTMGRMC